MSKPSEWYLDPRWQQKRLKVMARDMWTCTACGNKSQTLHVHHIKYNGKPWQAKDEDLQTLCERCHTSIGPHPKGGVGWETKEDGCVVFVYENCPACGCEEYRDKGGSEKCANCGHPMLPESMPSFVAGWGRR